MTPLKIRQYIAASVTTLSYVAIYLLRKPQGVVKTDLETTHHFTKNQLGWLDTSFFLPYALVQIFCGNLGDRYGARRTVMANLTVAALAMISFGFWSSPVVLCTFLFISGGAQATLWPNCVKCISDWFSKDELATVFGITGSVIYAGGIMGTSLAVYLQQLYSPDLRMIFVIPSLVCLMMALLVFVLLRTPQEVGIVVPEKDTNENMTAPKTPSKVEDQALNFMQVWKIQLVPELSFTMFGIKLVRYCLYMWLPLYLHQNLAYAKNIAGYLSNAFEIGCVGGSMGLGYIIDRFLGGRIHWGVCYSIIFSAVSLSMFQATSNCGLVFNFLFLFLAGAFQSGPDMIITGALAIEVGARENAQSAVCGIVNGFGSVGTIFQGPLIALVVTHFGWGGSFYGMIGLTLFGGLAIMKAAVIHDRRVAAAAAAENHNVI